MTGGGLLRSIGGWGVLKSMRKMNIHIKGDERILGDSDFVEKVLAQVREHFERKYHLKSNGFNPSSGSIPRGLPRVKVPNRWV